MRASCASRDGERVRRDVFGPQLENEAVRIDELRGDDVYWSFEIEDDTCGAGIDLGEANLFEAMIANLNGFGAMMRGSGRAETVQIEIKA